MSSSTRRCRDARPTDAERLLAAIRGTAALYSRDRRARVAGGLSFTATSGAHTAQIGDDLAIEGDVQLRASVTAPPGTTLVLLRERRARPRSDRWRRSK